MRCVLLAIIGGLLTACSGGGNYEGYKRAPYTIKGVRYHPMTVDEALTFSEEGLASWYDESSFFGLSRGTTALGETVYSSTECAAHKTLPLPSEVKVINLKNGKSTKVRVNDRGPFISGRIIDLSPRVAEKLDMKKAGLAPVRIEVVSVGDGKWKRKAGTLKKPVSSGIHGKNPSQKKANDANFKMIREGFSLPPF